ncbi:hypothetical protein SUGI_0498900 [Cryptomeria japonica]|nr:hypothetical protein SUGI_0498900 [Cryptomeria japonica]
MGLLPLIYKAVVRPRDHRLYRSLSYESSERFELHPNHAVHRRNVSDFVGEDKRHGASKDRNWTKRNGVCNTIHSH